jgi:hypothetical protein
MAIATIRAETLVVVVTLLATLAGANQASAQTETKHTRIGDLTYEAGFPTAETVKKLYDELDFLRAVLAYQYAEPLVAMHGMNIGLNQVGGRTGDRYLCQHFLGPHGIALTGNSTVIYAMAFLDLAKQGPMVVEVTPGSYGAFFDLWQQTMSTSRAPNFALKCNDPPVVT